MERAFENQECIKVSLLCVYNCSLVLKTENRSLSKAINVSNLNPSPHSPPPRIDVKRGTMSLDGSLCLIRDYLWSKFQQNRCQKPPKRGHISWILDRNPKDLKICNLTTVNATLMIHQNHVPPTP